MRITGAEIFIVRVDGRHPIVLRLRNGELVIPDRAGFGVALALGFLRGKARTS